MLSYKRKMEINNKANELRYELGIDDIVPINDVRSLIVDNDIAIVEEGYVVLDKETNETRDDFDAFIKKENDQFFIMLPTINKSVLRRRFTLAHELGHIYLGHFNEQETVYFRDDISREGVNIYEVEANYFAGVFLIPDRAVEIYLNLFIEDDSINIVDIMSKTYNVSKQATAIRVYTYLQVNKNIDPSTKQQISKQVVKKDG